LATLAASCGEREVYEMLITLLSRAGLTSRPDCSSLASQAFRGAWPEVAFCQSSWTFLSLSRPSISTTRWATRSLRTMSICVAM